MAKEILLPQWGMEMNEGTIVRWLKQEGDTIQEGEPLVEVETAKIETELESFASGIVAHILVPEGTTVPIRTLLAIVADPGEEVPRPTGPPPAPTSAAPAGAPARPTVGPAVAPTRPTDKVAAQVVPAARRLAQQNAIDLVLVSGTGPRGRVLIADVERAVQEQAGPPSQVGQVVPMTGMRRTIARRMMDSLSTTAQLTLTTEADVNRRDVYPGGAGPPMGRRRPQPSPSGGQGHSARLGGAPAHERTSAGRRDTAGERNQRGSSRGTSRGVDRAHHLAGR